jgi:hypothetical protein
MSLGDLLSAERFRMSRARSAAIARRLHSVVGRRAQWSPIF